MVFIIIDYEPHHYGAIERIGADLFEDQDIFRPALLELTRLSKVVLLGRKVVGFAIVVRKSMRSIEIAYLGVHSDFQHRGIGSQLLDYVKHVNNKQYLWLEVAYSNPDAQRLYERHGFRVSKSIGNQETGGVVMRCYTSR